MIPLASVIPISNLEFENKLIQNEIKNEQINMIDHQSCLFVHIYQKYIPSIYSLITS